MLQSSKVHNSSGLYVHLSATCKLEIFLCVRKWNVIIVLWTESLRVTKEAGSGGFTYMCLFIWNHMYLELKTWNLIKQELTAFNSGNLHIAPESRHSTIIYLVGLLLFCKANCIWFWQLLQFYVNAESWLHVLWCVLLLWKKPVVQILCLLLLTFWLRTGNNLSPDANLGWL